MSQKGSLVAVAGFQYVWKDLPSQQQSEVFRQRQYCSFDLKARFASLGRLARLHQIRCQAKLLPHTDVQGQHQ